MAELQETEFYIALCPGDKDEKAVWIGAIGQSRANFVILRITVQS